MPLRSASLLLAFALVAGCASTPASPPPEAGKAMPFSGISREQLGNAMWRLAFGVAELDARLAGDTTPDAEGRAAVVTLLGQLDKEVSALEASALQSSHPLFDINLSELQANAALAHRGAAADPPNYFAAGTLVAACQRCHQGR